MRHRFLMGVFVLDLIGFFSELIFLIAYVSNNSSFPEPLSPKEEKIIFQRYLSGDEEARNTLIERNLRLVAHIAKKYANTSIENEDLISIGIIGLIKAISTFNDSRGAQLATYAARCIENEILMTIRTNKKHKNEVMLNDPIGVDREGNEITLIDILGTSIDDVQNQVELNMQISHLSEIMEKVLRPREKLIIELRYGTKDGRYLTQREIASRLGISRSYISRIEKKSLQKLYKALEENRQNIKGSNKKSKNI